jgi:hypothetical protein
MYNLDQIHDSKDVFLDVVRHNLLRLIILPFEKMRVNFSVCHQGPGRIQPADSPHRAHPALPNALPPPTPSPLLAPHSAIILPMPYSPFNPTLPSIHFSPFVLLLPSHSPRYSGAAAA